MTLSLKSGYVKHVKLPKEIPVGPHWAIVQFETVTVTAGYEDDSVSEVVTRYHVFEDEQKWLEAIKYLAERQLERRYGAAEEFTAFHVDRVARAEVKITVGVT